MITPVVGNQLQTISSITLIKVGGHKDIRLKIFKHHNKLSVFIRLILLILILTSLNLPLLVMAGSTLTGIQMGNNLTDSSMVSMQENRRYTSATLKACLGVLPVLLILGLREYSRKYYTTFVGVFPEK